MRKSQQSVSDVRAGEGVGAEWERAPLAHVVWRGVFVSLVRGGAIALIQPLHPSNQSHHPAHRSGDLCYFGYCSASARSLSWVDHFSRKTSSLRHAVSVSGAWVPDWSC